MIEAEGTCMISASTSTTSCHFRTISGGTWTERDVIDVVAEEPIELMGSSSCDGCSRSCVLCRIFGALPIQCGQHYSSDRRTSRSLQPHQRPLHAFEQLRFIERLAQKTDRAALHGSLANGLMREGSNENDRHHVILSDQVFLQFEAAHAGHLHVRNDAGGFVQLG